MMISLYEVNDGVLFDSRPMHLKSTVQTQIRELLAERSTLVYQD